MITILLLQYYNNNIIIIIAVYLIYAGIISRVVINFTLCGYEVIIMV